MTDAVVCAGCPAYRTNEWTHPETYETGRYAWCGADRQRVIGSHHYDNSPRPDWCPVLEGEEGK